MSIDVISKSSFRIGFYRGFSSISQFNGPRRGEKAVKDERNQVATAWHDVGNIIGKSLEAAVVENGTEALKKR